MSAMLWRLHDVMIVTKGGCAICGDDDGFAPDADAFEETGKLICSPCYDEESFKELQGEVYDEGY